jgi:riboflavin biosynthesis pyrimidine reductase
VLQDEPQRPDLLAAAAAGVRLDLRTPTLSDAELQPLAPAGPARAARDVLAELNLRDGTPRCVAVMISTLDGRAAVEGRSVALGHPADRALLRELRTQVDAVLVGTRTLAAERYATLLDDDQRAHRREQGLPEHPLVATWSRTLDLPLDVPVFSEPSTPVVVYTSSEAAAPAGVEVRRVAGVADIPADLAARGMPAVSCEGGPTLLRELAAAGAIDVLLLTLAPLLAAGDAPAILEGPALAEPARLELRSVHRAGDHLFLRYARAGEAQ